MTLPVANAPTSASVAAQIAPDSYQSYAAGCFDQFSIHAMLQDSRGFLWFCTQDGLVRFDGATFTTLREADGVLFPHLAAICEQPGSDNTFWLGTAGAGLVRFCPDDVHRCRAFTTADGLSGDEVHALCFDAQGRLWVATEQGLSLCEVASPDSTAHSPHGFAARTVMGDNVRALAHFAGEIWVGTATGEVVVFDAGTAAETKRIKDLNKGAIKCLMRDASMGTWIGTERGGVVRVDDKGERTGFSTKDGLAHDHVAAAYSDSDGELWFCTWGGGVSRAKQRQFGRRLVFTTISTKEGLAANAIQSVFEDRDHRMWFGSVGAGATCLTPGKVRRAKFFQTFSTAEGLGNNMVA